MIAEHQITCCGSLATMTLRMTTTELIELREQLRMVRDRRLVKVLGQTVDQAIADVVQITGEEL